MKKVLLTLSIVGIAATVLAQGTLNFANAGAGLNARVYLGSVGSAQLPGGAAYTAQLFWGAAGASESALVPLTPTATFSTVASQAGYFFGGARTIETVPGGTDVTVQVRAWKTSSGATWDIASQNPLGEAGKSGLFTIKLATPPATPVNLVGLQSFAIIPVPEPSSFAVLGLGAAAMLIFRRRK